MQENILIVKGKLVSPDTKNFGLFLVYINKKDFSVEVNAVLGKSSFIAFYDTSALSYETMRLNMEQLLDRGEVSIGESRKLEEFLRHRQEIFVKLHKRDDFLHALELALTSRINIFYENRFKLSLFSELTNEVKHENVIQKSIQKASEEERMLFRKEYKVDYNVDVIPCEPILDPIEGVLVKNLEQGQFISCLVSQEWGDDIAIIERYNLKNENNEYKKLSGKILKIKKTKDEIRVFVQIKNTLFGNMSVDENVKLEIPKDPTQIIENTVEEEFNNDDFMLETEKKISRWEEMAKESPVVFYLGVMTLFVLAFIILYLLT